MNQREELIALRRLAELEAKAKGAHSPASADQAAKSVLSDMSGPEKFLVGIGKGFTDVGRGIGQLTGVMSRQDIDEARKYDKPLTDTGAGMAGDITGKIASAVPAMFIPGANTMLGATAIGAGLGALEPVGTGDSRLRNVTTGALGGAGGQVVGRGIAAGAKGAKALAEPFYKKGQEQIAARTLKAFAGNADDAARNLSSATELVQGSAPTAAEAAKDAGIAQLQRGLQAQSPKFASELSERALDQNAARIAALREITKHGKNLDAGIAKRAEVGSKLYAKAFGQKIRVDDKIKALTSRPSFQTALKRAERIAADEGAPLKNLFDQQGKLASVRGLHYVKMGYDDLINTAPQSGIGKAELEAIKKARSELSGWISRNNPDYDRARDVFEKMSRSINREEAVREIFSKSTRSQLPNVRGESTLYADPFARSLKDEGAQVAKAATGRANATLTDLMRPKQMQKLGAVRDDLARSVVAQNLGRSAGSNTAQNLASQNLMRQILGPTGMPQSWAESTLLQTVTRPVQWAAKAGEPGIQDALAKALLDPKYAASLMQQASTNPKAAALARALMQLSTPAGAAIPLQAGQ